MTNFQVLALSFDPLRVSNICRDLGHILILLTSKVLSNHQHALCSEEVHWNWLCGVPLSGCFQTPNMSFARVPLPRLVQHNFARFLGPCSNCVVPPSVPQAS